LDPNISVCTAANGGERRLAVVPVVGVRHLDRAQVLPALAEHLPARQHPCLLQADHRGSLLEGVPLTTRWDGWRSAPGLDTDLLALLQATAELELEDVAVTYRPGTG